MDKLTAELGRELRILREISLTDAQTAGGALFAEALRRLRAGQVIRQGGYDGEYGVIRLFAPGEREALLGQTSLLGVSVPSVSAASRPKAAPSAAVAPSQSEMKAEMNPEQRAAMESAARVTAVSAGPGTGLRTAGDVYDKIIVSEVRVCSVHTVIGGEDRDIAGEDIELGCFYCKMRAVYFIS